jgi:hypothetical protein
MLRSIGHLCAVVSSPPAAQQHRSAPDARAQGLQRDAKVCRGTQHERSRDKGLGATARKGQGGAGAAGKLRCLRSS